MRSSSQTASRLVKWFQNLPRWGQALVVLSGAGFLVLGLALNGSSSAGGLEANPTWLTLGIFLKMGVIILFILGAGVIARRYLGGMMGGSTHQMKVVETLSLSPRRSLHLVRIGDQTLLIGATDQAITLLSPVAPADPATSPAPVEAPVPVAFDNILASAQESLALAPRQRGG